MTCEMVGCERPSCYVIETRGYCATHAAELIQATGGKPGGWVNVD
jgi:hypothetical protein